jgi:hypothetical protein
LICVIWTLWARSSRPSQKAGESDLSMLRVGCKEESTIIIALLPFSSFHLGRLTCCCGLDCDFAINSAQKISHSFVTL